MEKMSRSEMLLAIISGVISAGEEIHELEKEVRDLSNKLSESMARNAELIQQKCEGASSAATVITYPTVEVVERPAAVLTPTKPVRRGRLKGSTKKCRSKNPTREDGIFAEEAAAGVPMLRAARRAYGDKLSDKALMAMARGKMSVLKGHVEAMSGMNITERVRYARDNFPRAANNSL